MHVSPPVQTLPSSHAEVLATDAQPFNLSQVSSVQGLLSLQLVALPALQIPPLQASSLLQASPSVQVLALGKFVQPAAGLAQASSVQGLPSSHFIAPTIQVPDWHLSPLVHLLPASQAPPSALAAAMQAPSLQVALQALTTKLPQS